jgi:hypothetical protein
MLQIENSACRSAINCHFTSLMHISLSNPESNYSMQEMKEATRYPTWSCLEMILRENWTKLEAFKCETVLELWKSWLFPLPSAPSTIFHQKQQRCTLPKLADTTMQKTSQIYETMFTKPNKLGIPNICKMKVCRDKWPSRP